MQVIDWVVVVAYFLGLVGIVWWSSRQQSSAKEFFLAGRSAGWFVVGASLFASNIGSEHIVGLAGNGATSGMAMAHWELHAWIMVLLAWVFVPFYYRAGVFTIPEFLEKRFNARTRWILSVVSLVAYVFTKVSVTVYAGAVVFVSLLPEVPNAFWVGAVSTVLLTGIYTVFGGLRAVIYTEVAQTFLLLLGSVCITWAGLSQLGGWGELQSAVAEKKETFALWRPLSDPDFPWLGILIASPVIGIWYWCTDQYIIQRTLAAKSLRDARRGALWGGFLKVWPVFIFLVPGLIGWALYERGMLAIPVKEDGSLQGDQVFPALVSGLLPVGLRGLVVAGLLSALMSSLASLFNSCATLFTVDIYRKLKPETTDEKMVKVGRIATGVVVVAGLLWIPIMQQMAGGGIYKYLQSVQGYLAPPITAVFLLGLFWKRINSQGAVAGLLVGFVFGIGKMALEAVASGGGVDPDGLIAAIAGFNFLYYSGVLLLISSAVIIGVSMLTPAQDLAGKGVTFSSLSAKDREEIRASWTKGDVWATAGVLGLVVVVYLYFSFWV